MLCCYIGICICCCRKRSGNKIALNEDPSQQTIQMAGNDTSVQDMDEKPHQVLDLSMGGDSNIKGLDSK